MGSPRTGTSRRASSRRYAAWAALSVGWLLPSAGCQIEYAGMTLPSGKYMHDDVQYFPPGTDFPWANTQAATQRARMQAMGVDTGGSGPLVVPPAAGAINPLQAPFGRPGDVTSSPLSVEAAPGANPQPPAPGGGAGGVVPAPEGSAPDPK